MVDAGWRPETELRVCAQGNQALPWKDVEVP